MITNTAPSHTHSFGCGENLEDTGFHQLVIKYQVVARDVKLTRNGTVYHLDIDISLKLKFNLRSYFSVPINQYLNQHFLGLLTTQH